MPITTKEELSGRLKSDGYTLINEAKAETEFDGLVECYAAIKYNRARKGLSYCVILILYSGDDDLDLPSIATFKSGNLKLTIRKGSSTRFNTTTNLQSLIGGDKERGRYTILIYEAEATNKPPYSAMEREDPKKFLSDTFSGVCDALVPSKDTPIGRGTTGMVFDAKENGRAVKVITKKATSAVIEGELKGNQTVRTKVIEQSSEDHSDMTTSSRLSSVRTFEFPSKDWKKLYGACSMALADATVSADQFKKDGKRIGIDHKEFKRLIEGTAKALQAMHKCGVAHFDIKPDNMGSSLQKPRLFERRKKAYKLLDFGCSSLTVSYRTGASSSDNYKSFIKKAELMEKQELQDTLISLCSAVKGTPAYAAPEIGGFLDMIRARGKIITIVKSLKDKSTPEEEKREGFKYLQDLISVGRPADIYSLGASILELLGTEFGIKSPVGETAYGRTTLNEVTRTIDSAWRKGEINDKEHEQYLKLFGLLHDMLNPKPEDRPTIDDVLKHEYLR